MLGVFGVGLWAIISFGYGFHAPTDLSGQWELRAPQAEKPNHVLAVQQSGQYFNIKCDQVQYSLKLVSETTDPNGKINIAMAGDGLEINMLGQPDGEQYTVRMKGIVPAETEWQAVRVQRTYPKRGAKASTNPAHAGH